MLEKSPTINKSFGYMTLERMGSRYPSRLSFSRSMLRRMKQEKWVVDRVKFDLDKDGYGTAIYEIKSLEQTFYRRNRLLYGLKDERVRRRTI